ncbi:MAG: hypothetical protein R2862_06120 [Thermoanaerobaculia bacterium]
MSPTLSPPSIRRPRRGWAPHLVWTVPLVLFGIFRFSSCSRSDDARSPTDAILRDPPFLANLALWGVVVLSLIMAPDRRLRYAFAGLFFASGFRQVLVDQVVWLRYLALVFGNTTLATATILAVFWAVSARAPQLFSRHAEALAESGRAVAVYALLEAGIGLFAIFSPRLFAAIDSVYIVTYPLGRRRAAPLRAAPRGLAALVLLRRRCSWGARSRAARRPLRAASGRQARVTGRA